MAAAGGPAAVLAAVGLAVAGLAVAGADRAGWCVATLTTE
jgi:hypothetical protein